MAVSAVLLLVLRFYLVAENKRRDAEQHDDSFDDVYVTHVNKDGTTEEKKVDRVCHNFELLLSRLLTCDLFTGLLGFD